MTLVDWMRSNCRLTDQPRVFASEIAERYLTDNGGDAETVIAELVEMGMCPRSLPHAYAGMTLLVFDAVNHDGLTLGD